MALPLRAAAVLLLAGAACCPAAANAALCQRQGKVLCFVFSTTPAPSSAARHNTVRRRRTQGAAGAAAGEQESNVDAPGRAPAAGLAAVAARAEPAELGDEGARAGGQRGAGEIVRDHTFLFLEGKGAEAGQPFHRSAYLRQQNPPPRPPTLQKRPRRRNKNHTHGHTQRAAARRALKRRARPTARRRASARAPRPAATRRPPDYETGRVCPLPRFCFDLHSSLRYSRRDGEMEAVGGKVGAARFARGARVDAALGRVRVL